MRRHLVASNSRDQVVYRGMSECGSEALGRQRVRVAERGSCYCGRVIFEVQSDCTPNLSVYCHCESCRRAHAAPLYQVIYVPNEAFRIVAGSELVKQFKKTEESVVRAFCGECGSRVYNIVTPKPQLGVGFFPALLSEATQHDLPPAFRPLYHYCSEESVIPLHLLCDGLDRRLCDGSLARSTE